MYNENCPFATEEKEKQVSRENTDYTADMILLTQRDGVWYVLLIERRWDPYQGKLALPGGYVEEGETSEQAARRETYEEVNLKVKVTLTFVKRYADPGRDPRGDVASDAFVVVLPNKPKPKAGDDARNAEWIPVTEALNQTLAFDHGTILRDALSRAGVKI